MPALLTAVIPSARAASDSSDQGYDYLKLEPSLINRYCFGSTTCRIVLELYEKDEKYPKVTPQGTQSLCNRLDWK
jgi:hypothetical protein